MRQKLAFAILVVLLFGGSYAVLSLLERNTPRGAPEAPSPGDRGESGINRPGTGYQRIVSLAPSITETLYALGLGEKVVGVTRYCDYPPEVKAKGKVGDYFNPSYEAIVALRPDLVVLLEEDERAKEGLADLGLAVLAVDHKTISGVLESFTTVGKACACEGRAQQLRLTISERIERVKKASGRRPKPRVMICIGRPFGDEPLRKVSIAGQDGFYNEMLRLAGGVNVYQDRVVKFPEVSAEGILTLDPDVIIDMVPQASDDENARAAALKQWQALGSVKAVKGGRVYILGGQHLMRPGPRFVQTLEDIARVIQRESKAE
jgi:iron complex transport system substrate-binding protein